jgi:hypothetical protein
MLDELKEVLGELFDVVLQWYNAALEQVGGGGAKVKKRGLVDDLAARTQPLKCSESAAMREK